MTREKAINYLYSSGFSEKQVNTIAKAFEPIPKNDLGVDCVSRQIISDYVESHIQEINAGYGDLNRHTNSILRMIVDYVENMPSVTPQEPCIYYDAFNKTCRRSEVPQEPILDKIYADIQKLRGCSCSCSDGIIDDVEDIIDKYKAESEVENGNDD